MCRLLSDAYADLAHQLGAADVSPEAILSSSPVGDGGAEVEHLDSDDSPERCSTRCRTSLLSPPNRVMIGLQANAPDLVHLPRDSLLQLWEQVDEAVTRSARYEEV